jgi:hypothetical protein
MTNSLTIQTSLAVGLPQAQRVTASTNLKFTGSIGDDLYNYLSPGEEFTIPDKVTAFTAFADGPLLVTMDSQSLIMQELMVCDVATGLLKFKNIGVSLVTLHVTYVGEP